MYKKFLFFLALLLFFSGCLDQKLSAEKRQACISLSSHSAVSVPECNTQEECMQKVEENFFSFNQTVFSEPVSLKLLSFKNHLARAWLFSNKSVNLAREINLACLNKDYGSLPFKVNELNFYLTSAFGEIDSADLDAFAVLVLEVDDLEREGVDQIKEEALFDDFIKFNHELNELFSQRSQKDSGSLVGFYFSMAQKLEEFSEGMGFSAGYVEEFSLTEVLGFLHQPLMERLPSNSFFVPLLKAGAENILSFVFAQSKLERSLELLERMPSFEVLLLFNGFVGANDSVSSRFSSYLESDSLHRAEVLKETKEKENSIRELFSSLESRVNAIDSASYSSLDQGFLVELFSLLEAPSSLSFSGTNFSDLKSFQAEAENRLLDLRLHFNQVVEERFLGEKGLGSVLKEFKEIYLGLRALSEEIDFFSSEAVESLNVLCDSRVSFVESELNNALIPEESFIDLVGLKARIEFKLNSYPFEENKTKRLVQCKKIIELFKDFSLGLRDFKLYSKKKELKTRECFSFLEKLFSSGLDLSNFIERFHSLESLDSEFRDTELVSGTCLSLRQDLENYVFSLPEFRELNKGFALAEKEFSWVKGINSGFPGLLSERFVSSLESRFSYLSSFFDGEKIDLIKSLGLWTELKESINDFLLELSEAKKTALAEFFKKNFKAVSFSDSVVETGVPFTNSTRLVFSNPFNFSLSGPLAVSIPFKPGSPFTVSFASENISVLEAGNESLTVSFSFVPRGSSVLQLDSNGLVEVHEENNSILSLTSQEALIQRTLSFKTASTVSVLRASTELPRSLSLKQARVFFKEKAVGSFQKGNLLFFDLKGVGEKDRAEVYLTLLDPLKTGISLKETREIDLNNSFRVYSIEATNLLPFEAKRFSLMFPLDLRDYSIASKTLLDSAGRKQPFEVLSNGSISIPSISLKPGETKKFELVLQVKDPQKYYESLLLSAEKSLNELSFSENPEVKTSAQDLLEELAALKKESNLFGEQWLQQLLGLQKQLLSLQLREQSLSSSLNQFLELKQKSSKELNEFGEEISSLRELGFRDYALELHKKLRQGKSLFLKAAQEQESNETAEAINSLLQVLSILSAKPKTDAFSLIEARRAELMQQFNSLLEAPEELLDQNALPLKESIFLLDEGISAALMENDLLKGKKRLDELSSQLLDLNSSIEGRFLSEAKKVYSKALSFSEMLSKQGALKTLNKLRSLFSSPIPSSYAPPISKSRLEKIALQLNSLNSAGFSQKLSGFLSSYSSAPAKELFLRAKSLSIELESKSEKLFSLNSELNSALERIQEDSFTFLNSAKELSQKLSLGTEAQNLLVKAENETKKGNFIESIALSRQVYFMALNKNSPPSGFSILSIPPIAFPLVLLIAAAVYFKKRKDSKPKPKTRMQKILREYW